MSKCPYSFPDRTRKAMIAYLAAHCGYHPMNSWNGGFVLSWNIKVYNADYSGKSGDCDSPVCERFDAQWDEYVRQNNELFWEACSDAARQYMEKEWTNWPGIEQGEWGFSLNGRSGGHMILTEAPGWLPAPRAWAMSSMIWESRAAYQRWLAELDTKTLTQFYRAIRVLDHDLRREAVESEVSWQIALQRSQWEEDLIRAENCGARKMEGDRPDLYPAN